MLHHPSGAAERRQRKAKAQREWRQRRAKRRLLVGITVTPRMIAAFLRWHWIQPHERTDKDALAEAIEKGLYEAIDTDDPFKFP
jgi:hypothetical protein